MKLSTQLPIVLAVGAAAFWVWRQNQLSALRAEIIRTGAAHAHASAIDRRSTDGQSPSVDTNELSRLRALRPELLRLRGSIQSLRQLAKQDPARLETEASQVRKEADLIRARRLATERSQKVQNHLGMALMLAKGAAQESGQGLARSWDDVRSQLIGTTNGGRFQPVHYLRMLEEAAKPGGWLGEIELLTVPGDVRQTQNAELPAHLYAREREPRAQPDGGWARWYGWLNEEDEEVHQADADFSTWEREHLRRVPAKP